MRDPDIITALEAARLLGIGRATVYDAVGRGELPHRRIGRRVIFSKSALQRWLADQDAGVARKYRHAGS